MPETIFIDRRKQLDRRHGHMPYGVRDCRRRACDRRRETDPDESTHWWLNVNYAVAEIEGSGAK
jgi:hypothetical protein